MKKNMLSAIQPTSVPHLGNYLGAIQNWVQMQQDYNCYFFVVDLHAITVPQDPKKLREQIYKMLAYCIACGLDPNQCIMFCQSHVPQHAELAWVLNCNSYMGELSRMTQFKDKSQKQGANIPAGLFNYPVLMAADILLYQTDFVPVGEDQKQHIELARNLAERCNLKFGEKVFTVPNPLIGKEGARIMDLQDPTSKMSKSSENQKGVLYLDDSDKSITQKIKSAVTDSGTEVVYSDEKKGLKNLIDIHCKFTNKTKEEVVKSYEGKMYGHLKVDTAELVVAGIRPIREKAEALYNDKAYLQKVLQEGALKAGEHAQQTLKLVYDKVGLISLK